MSKHQRLVFISAAMIATAAAAVLSAAPAGAADPVFDSQSANGPTAGNSSDFGRNIMREAERAPSLTERFGLPRISGPIPPILPPQREQPIFYSPNTTVPPPPVIRARRNTPDG